MEMNNEDLGKALNGWDVSGFDENVLKEELEGDSAAAFIEKCKRDPQLRKSLSGLCQHVESDKLRDELIQYVLQEPDVWLEARNTPDYGKAAAMQAMVFVEKTLRKEFDLDHGDMSSLCAAVMDRNGRGQILKLVDRLVLLPKEQRRRGDPEMEALVANLWKVGAGFDISSAESNVDSRPPKTYVGQEVTDRKDGAEARQVKGGTDSGGSSSTAKFAFLILATVAAGIAAFFAFGRKNR
jgi:hypothetical protein